MDADGTHREHADGGGPALDRRYWFGPRKWGGWGWRPLSWEGWAVMAVWAVGELVAVTVAPANMLGFAVTAGTIALVAVCALKGTPPGGRSSPWHEATRYQQFGGSLAARKRRRDNFNPDDPDLSSAVERFDEHRRPRD